MLTREERVETRSWDWEVEAESSWSKAPPTFKISLEPEGIESNYPSDPSAQLLPMENLRPMESLRPGGYVFVYEGFDLV